MVLDVAPRRLVVRRGGFTLIEVVLVMSLLVILASITVPYLGHSFSRAHLNAADDILRDALTRGRLTAMQSGEIQAFRCEPKGARFQLVALDKLSLPESSTPPPDKTDGEHSAHDILRLSPPRLPDDVVFASADIASSNQVAALYGSISDSGWSVPILFNPDGTTSDASIVLQNDQGQTIRVTLRGVTGLVTSSAVGNEAAQ
jgi:prepilin-type N-terminal cleavage/methylation domain-containing protein